MSFVHRTTSYSRKNCQAVAAIAFALTVSSQVYAGDAPPAKAPQANNELPAEVQAVLDLTNKERQKVGLPPLKANATLMKVAADHSVNMARRGSLNHTLDGKSPFDRMSAAGYAFGSAGENIAWGASTPEEVVQMWMNSPGHRSNLLSREYSEIGIGVAKSDRGRAFHTQVFAAPMSTSTATCKSGCGVRTVPSSK
jgi:uncharacterized protein YkwD